jgi:hypothetical protein
MNVGIIDKLVFVSSFKLEGEKERFVNVEEMDTIKKVLRTAIDGGKLEFYRELPISIERKKIIPSAYDMKNDSFKYSCSYE